MTCEELGQQLAYFRQLGPAQQQLVRRHLARCPACAARWLAYQQQDRALAALPARWPSPKLARAVMAHTLARRRAEPQPRWRQAAVAVVALLLAVTVLGTIGVSADSLPGDALYPFKRAMEGARLTLTLSPVEHARYARQLDEVRRRELQRALAERRRIGAEIQGTLQHIDGETWDIGGFTVVVPASAWEGDPPVEGTTVMVRALIADGEIEAQWVQLPGYPLSGAAPHWRAPTGSLLAQAATRTPTAPRAQQTAESQPTRPSGTPTAGPPLAAATPSPTEPGAARPEPSATLAPTVREPDDHEPRTPAHPTPVITPAGHATRQWATITALASRHSVRPTATPLATRTPEPAATRIRTTLTARASRTPLPTGKPSRTRIPVMTRVVATLTARASRTAAPTRSATRSRIPVMTRVIATLTARASRTLSPRLTPLWRTPTRRPSSTEAPTRAWPTRTPRATYKLPTATMRPQSSATPRPTDKPRPTWTEPAPTRTQPTRSPAALRPTPTPAPHDD